MIFDYDEANILAENLSLTSAALKVLRIFSLSISKKTTDYPL